MAKKEKKEKKGKKGKKVPKVKEVVYEKNILLILAKGKDFSLLDKRVSKNKYTYAPKYGVPYWLIQSDGTVGSHNYIFNEDTDVEDFKIYLHRQQILIQKQWMKKTPSPQKKKSKNKK